MLTPFKDAYFGVHHLDNGYLLNIYKDLFKSEPAKRLVALDEKQVIDLINAHLPKKGNSEND